MTEEDMEDILLAHSLSAIRLLKAKGMASRCKLGGLPDVSEGFAWPFWEGDPLQFLAQLDLSVLPRIYPIEDLAGTGMLYFFYDHKQRTGGLDPRLAGCWRVIYSVGPEPWREAEPPEHMPEDCVLFEKPLMPRVIRSYPSLKRLAIDSALLPENAEDIEQALRSESFRRAPVHQIGGYPNPLLDDRMELTAQLASNGHACTDPRAYQRPKAQTLAPGAADWLLLLQIDAEDITSMILSDSDRLYFWIRKQDLARHDFSKVWMIAQRGIPDVF